MAKTRYWALQESEDPSPVAVIAVLPGDVPRRYVPGQGLVDWPSMVAYTHNGEPGAHRISTAEALALIRQNVGRIDPGMVKRAKGNGETIPVPRE